MNTRHFDITSLLLNSATASLWLAALVGVGLTLACRADMLALFGLAAPWPWVGYAVTGLLIGRGANFVHDFFSRWLGSAR